METGFGPFDTARKALTVTATMRRAARDAATGWRFGEEQADAFIVGHPAGKRTVWVCGQCSRDVFIL